MSIRILAAVLLATVVRTRPSSQAAPAAPPQAELRPGRHRDAASARIVVALDRAHARRDDGANFLHYVDTHRFDGEEPSTGRCSVGRRRLDPGRSPKRLRASSIRRSRTSRRRETGLHNVAGAISMANAGPGTARADFFILASDMPSLDATAADRRLRRLRSRHRRDGRGEGDPRGASSRRRRAKG